MFLRIEKRDDNQTRHKLAALAEGPFKVVNAVSRVITIERADGSIEKVSRDRVVLAPPVWEEAEIANAVRPMTDDELEIADEVAEETKNLRTAPGFIEQETQLNNTVNDNIDEDELNVLPTMICILSKNFQNVLPS